MTTPHQPRRAQSKEEQMDALWKALTAKDLIPTDTLRGRPGKRMRGRMNSWELRTATTASTPSTSG